MAEQVTKRSPGTKPAKEAKAAVAASRQLTGTVVSDKAAKTIVVAVERRVRHPIYRKAYTVTSKFMAHDPEDIHKTGEVVTIRETRPRSARKRWEVVEAGGAK